MDNNKYIGFRLERKFIFFGIPLVGILVAFIFKDENTKYFSIYNAISIIITTIITGINWLGCRYIVIKLWNKYPWHLKPIKHIVIEIPLVYAFTLSLLFFNFLFYSLVLGEEMVIIEFWQNAAIVIILVSFLVSFHEALFFYIQWKENFNKSLILEKANIKAEYDALKNQINPHFLFNNLNTLITYVEDNPEATNYIQNLSDFLRYTLDLKESDNKTVKEELKIVEKYIYLQKSRFNEYLKVNIDISEKFYSNLLPSMALQMLVDNAIKHNIISKNKPLSINIHIENNQYIVVENNIQKRYDAISTNQGLNNLKNRYTFLSEKSIIIMENNNKFIVKLPLV